MAPARDAMRTAVSGPPAALAWNPTRWEAAAEAAAEMEEAMLLWGGTCLELRRWGEAQGWRWRPARGDGGGSDGNGAWGKCGAV